MPTLRRTALLLSLTLAACSQSHRTLTNPRAKLPTDNPRTFLTSLLTDSYHGKSSAVLDRTAFQNDNQREVFKRLIAIAAGMQAVHDALFAVFPKDPHIGPDPLDAALDSVNTAVIRLEPPDTARIVPPPPGAPFTLIAQNHHWKLDYARTQPGASQPVPRDALRSLDDAAKNLLQLAAAIRKHQYPTADAALAALAGTKPPPTSQPATQPTP